MATPNRSRPGLWSSLVGAVVLLAAASGWWFGHHQQAGQGAPRHSKALIAEAVRLRQRLDRQEASAAEKQRLLELLIALDRQDQAISLLEPLADREPDRWSLRLMLAELRRDRGDRSGAERELRMILSRKPDQVEALQLMTLLKLEQGHGAAAEAEVRQAYERASRPETKPGVAAGGAATAAGAEHPGRGHLQQAGRPVSRRSTSPAGSGLAAPPAGSEQGGSGGTGGGPAAQRRSEPSGSDPGQAGRQLGIGTAQGAFTWDDTAEAAGAGPDWASKSLSA
jgi:hypothetical protein